MEQENYEVACDGNLKIANDVVGKIAAIAALEVDGVSAMGNNVTSELLGKIGVFGLMKNVRVEVLDGEAKLDLAITVEYGKNIPIVSQAVQARVKTAVEGMTGLKVSDVNVRIAGVNLAREASEITNEEE